MQSTRRSFLRRSVLGTAAFSFPTLLLPRKGMAQGNAVIGSGEYKFECIHNWGQLPEDHTYGEASHGVAVDSAGCVYITHHGKPGSIFAFDPEGKFMRAMGEIHKGKGHGIEIRKEGNDEFIYVTSDDRRESTFAKMTLKGDVIWKKGAPAESGKYGEGKGRFVNTNLSFCPDGGFHVGDGYGSNWMHRYDRDANYVSTFGGGGKEDGKFSTPHGQVLDERDGTPKLLVADRANKRLQYLSLDGQYLSKIEGFLFPADADIGPRGELLVPDLHARISILDRQNKPVVHLGDDEGWRARVLDGFKLRRRGSKGQYEPGKFIHPHDAKFTKDGHIICAEWVQDGRVTFLKRVS